jgi:hypothetical protein
MLRAKRLDHVGVAKLKVPDKRMTGRDPECRGHYIRITSNGAKSYWPLPATLPVNNTGSSTRSTNDN